jgi:toxin CcdB
VERRLEIILVAQFDVFPNPDSATRKAVPYVVVLQSNQVPVKASTIVAPLARKAISGVAPQLQRAVLVEGEPLVLLFQAISAVRTSALA